MGNKARKKSRIPKNSKTICPTKFILCKMLIAYLEQPQIMVQDRLQVSQMQKLKQSSRPQSQLRILLSNLPLFRYKWINYNHHSNYKVQMEHNRNNVKDFPRKVISKARIAKDDSSITVVLMFIKVRYHQFDRRKQLQIPVGYSKIV